MITRFSVSNFKVLARVPEDGMVEFGPLNVLIGPNGSGKSSLLQAIDFLRAFFMSSVEVYLKDHGWDYRDLPNLRQTQKTIRWEVEASLSGDRGRGAGRYRYRVSLQPHRYLGIGEEHLSFIPNGAAPESPVELLARRGRKCSVLDRTKNQMEHQQILVPASYMSGLKSEDKDRHPELFVFRSWVERFRSFLIWDPKVLRYPDRGPHREIGPSGDHLAPVLGRLRDRNREAFEHLIRRLKRLFPTVSGISIHGRGWGWREIRLHEGNGKEKEVVFNSRQMSDGVLRLLAVTSMLYTEDAPSVITFEEPENGVHPQLIREVVQILREMTQRKPPNTCQVFFTTHSPYVLDEFFDHPEEVYCLDRARPQAGARIVRLTENKQIDLARDTFKNSLGEAWFTGVLGATAKGSRP